MKKLIVRSSNNSTFKKIRNAIFNSKYNASFMSKTTKIEFNNILKTSIKKFSDNIQDYDREVIETDILIVGAGPAGLSTAIKLAQLAKEKEKELSITIVEKGEEVGSHILSGNCFEPDVLSELFTDLKNRNPPIKTKVTEDVFKILLNDKKCVKVPNFLLPKSINNHNNYIISLSELTRWMAVQAEELGISIFSGFAASKPKFNSTNQLVGVYLNDFGINKKGNKKDSYQKGNLIIAKQTILAEGCRGSLSEEILNKFKLRTNPQHYGLGLKEVWEIDIEKNKFFKPGLVQHTVFWPTDNKTYSGSFMYHMEPNLIHVGFVVGLDYQNPYLNPYEEFQKFKTHSDIRKYLENGECIAYGARSLNEGGFYSLPKLTFPGGLFVGCSAGMLNVAKIKGTHNAIKSGIIAAKSIFEEHLTRDIAGKEIFSYQENFNKSSIFKELYSTRNFHGAFSKGGLFFGMIHGYISNLLGGREPWKFIPSMKDSEKLKPKENFKPIVYPKKDGKLTFDILENLSRSGTNHEHDQPTHLKIKKGKENVNQISLNVYGGPEEKFCPAKVYEFIDQTNESGKIEKVLQINAQNCLHCKCCSIKMVDEYIDWTVPEGSGGPKYTLL